MKKKSKQSEETKSYFSNPIYSAIPFQAFAQDVEIPKKMPQEQEVDSLFNKLIEDYEFSPAKKQMLNSKPINEKWNMYVQQTNEDSESPSPEYLLKCLQLRPGPEVLAEIAKLIEKRRCSFLQRFLGLNLHQFCLSLLCTFNRKTNPLNPSDIPLNEVVTNSLLVLKNFSHTQFGTTLSAYSEAIPYLVESISASSSSNLECAVEILTSFLVDSKNMPIVANIKNCIKALEAQSKSVWNNFLKELAKPDKSTINLLSVFTNRMLQIPNDPEVRLRVIIAMEKNGYINAFKAVKADPSNKIIEPIKQRMAADILMLKTISPTIMADPFSIKSLSISIKELAQPPKLYHSFLISLYDVFINFKMSRINLLVFLHNFLLIYRYYLSKNDKNKIAVAAASAAANDHPIELQFTAAKYKAQESHKQLFQECYYLCNAELASLDLSKFCKIVSPSQDASQKTEATPNPAEIQAKLDEKTNEVTTLKKKLIVALQENKSLKENAQNSNTTQNNELTQLKSQIQSLQAQNTALKNQGSSSSNENAQLKSQIQTLQAEISTLKNQGSSSSNENAQLKSQIQSLQSEISTLKNQGSSSSDQNSQLKQQVETLLAENTKLKSEIEQHQNSSKEKEAQKVELSNEITQLKKKLIAALQEKKTLKAENEQHLTTNKEKEDKNKELLGEIDKLKKQIDDLLTENTNLKNDSEQQLLNAKDREVQENEINSLKTENSKVTNELNQLKEEQQKSKQEVQQLTTKINEINEKLTQKSDECNKATKEADELKSQIESLRKSSDSNSNEVSNLKQENEKLSSEIESLKSKVQEKETTANQSINEINSLNNEIQNLKQQKTNLNNELEKVKSQLSSKDASLDSAKSQKESIEKDLEKVKAELKALKNSKENDDSSRSNLENELSSIKKQLEDANNKINELKVENQEAEKSNEEAKSTHQNEVSSLQSQIKTLESSVSERDDKINQLNKTLESQTKDLESASSKEIELNKQISELLSKGTNDELLQTQLTEKDNLLADQKKEVDELRKQIEKLNNDAIVQNNVLKQTNEKVSSKDQEIVQLKSQNQKDKDEINTKEQEIVQLKSQNQKDKDEINTKEQEISQLKNQSEKVQNELKTKEQEISQLKNQSEKVQNDIKIKDQEIESLKDQVSNHKKESDQKTTEISNLKSKVSDLESQLKTANEEITSKASDLQASKEALEKGSNASQNELQELKAKFAQLEKELTQSQTEKENHINSLKSKDTEIDSLKSKSESNDKEIEQLKNQLESSKKEIEQLKSESLNQQQEKQEIEKEEIKSLKLKLDQLTTENQKTTEQLEKLTEEHQNAKSQLESANNQLNQHSSSSEEKSKENERLQSELDQARKEVDDYKTKLEEAHKDSLQIRSQVEEIEKSSKLSIDKLETTLLENERLIVEVQEQKDIINQLSLTNQENENNSTQLKEEVESLTNRLQTVQKQNQQLQSEIERKTEENAKLKKDIVDLTPSQNAQLQEQQHRERVRKISDASLSKKLPQKPLLNPPKTKTCLLKWSKLPDDLVKTSFWSNVDENSINFNPDFFASTTHYIPQYKFASSNNFLVLTKLDPDSIVELLRTMNITNEANYDQLFTNEVLELLKDIVPSNEEAEYLSSMEESELTIYEKFMKNLASIPSLNMRVQFLIIHKNFTSKVENMKQPYEQIIKGLNDLIQSDKVKELLATILRIGNYSNGGNQEFGGAYGFTLDSISKIRETEIPMFISRNYIDLLQELEILKPIIDNKEVQLRKSSEIIQKYSDELLLCMLEMPNAEIRLKDGDNFWTVFMDFYGANRSSLDSVKELSLDAIKLLNEALLLFAEEENEEFSDFAAKISPLYLELNRGKVITNAIDQQFEKANRQNNEQSNDQDNQLGQFQHETIAAPIAQIKDTFKNALGKFFTKK